MKTCRECGEQKPLDAFHRMRAAADGRNSRCKSCRLAFQRRPDVLDRKAQYDRDYRGVRNAALNARIRRWKRENPDKCAAAYRREHGKAPEKFRARARVSRAVRSGALRKRPCEACGSARVHAHHHDYSRPLDVRWLCPAHHRQAHQESAV